MNKKKIIIIIALLAIVVIGFFPVSNYLKTRILWKNVFDLKYEGSNYSSAFVGGEYTLSNKTNNTYKLEYIYVYVETIGKGNKTVKIKAYKTLLPNSSIEIQIREDDLLEAFGLEERPMWSIYIKGFEYKKQ